MTHVYVVIETVTGAFELVFDTQAGADQWVALVTKNRQNRNRPTVAYRVLKCALCREDLDSRKAKAKPTGTKADLPVLSNLLEGMFKPKA